MCASLMGTHCSKLYLVNLYTSVITKAFGKITVVCHDCEWGGKTVIDNKRTVSTSSNLQQIPCDEFRTRSPSVWFTAILSEQWKASPEHTQLRFWEHLEGQKAGPLMGMRESKSSLWDGVKSRASREEMFHKGEEKESKKKSRLAEKMWSLRRLSQGRFERNRPEISVLTVCVCVLFFTIHWSWGFPLLSATERFSFSVLQYNHSEPPTGAFLCFPSSNTPDTAYEVLNN